MMSRNAFLARSSTSARFNSPSGWGMTLVRMPGDPRAAATSLPSSRKTSVTTVTVATPLLSSSMESWKLHDVHEPQSATALIT